MTQVPLPAWRDLCRASFAATPSTKVLSRGWVRDGDTSRWFSRSAWSLIVLAHWRQKVAGRRDVTVWVPDFFCDESLPLLRTSGARLVFYPVDVHQHPDHSRFPEVDAANRPDLFLLVHYFGQPSPADGAVALCSRHGAWLVEDAAHVLLPIPGVGEAGDCTLYSPHKHLAIPDGAVLVVHQDGPSGLGARGDLLTVLDQVSAEILRTKRSQDMRMTRWVGKRVLQRVGFRSRRRPPGFSLDPHPIPAVTEAPAMSDLAARLLERELNRLASTAAQRSRLAAAWDKALPIVLPPGNATVLPGPQTPYLACVATDEPSTAAELYAQLQSVGVPVATWPDLPPEVVGSESSHGAAIRLRHTRVYLPVHQTMKMQQISSATRALLARAPGRWRMRQIESRAEWEGLWADCKAKTLPQAWEYGSAKAEAEGWRALRYLVCADEDAPIALFQVLVKGLPGVGGVARINRGPLMLRDEPAEGHALALRSIAALLKEARRNRWWMSQIAPLLPPGPDIEEALRHLGLRKLADYPADSAKLSLEDSEDQLLMRLDRKWRNCLRKGQKLGVSAHLDEGATGHFAWLIDFYKTQQRAKAFVGTSEAMLQALTANQSDSYRFNLFLGTDGAELSHQSLLGVLVTVQFGDVTEYLIGAVNDKGRAQQANSVLLWEALLHAKRKGSRWFDVGGLAANTPPGIADFKRGLNGEPYELVGEWRRWF